MIFKKILMVTAATILSLKIDNRKNMIREFESEFDHEDL